MPFATADKALTAKQQRFAALVANGLPKAAAHRQVYVSQREPKAQQKRALETAKAPHVAAEIKRLTWLALPVVDDIRGMREHAIRVIADLSRSDPSGEVRLKAALALYKIAEATRAASNPGADSQEQDRLLAALRKLYTQVQARAAQEDDDPDIGPPPRPLDDDPIDLQAIVVREPSQDGGA